MDDARSARLCACVQMIVAIAEIGGFERKLRQPLVGKAHSLQPPEPRRVIGQAIFDHAPLRRHDLDKALQKPGVVMGEVLHFGHGEALAQRLHGDQQPVRRRPYKLRLYRSARRAFRSEEHTSELQSLMRISYAVFCLKKKNTYTD